jgi:hypothetical protein
LRDWAFAIAVIAFIGFVGLRVPWLNHNAFWLETTLIAMLALSLLGGIAFKGRSGWCGTFCPLAPIQRFYSHAPIIRVRNGEDPGHAGQRRFFMTTMPGVLCGYFLQGPSPSYGEPLHAVIFVMAALSSAGLYQAIISFSELNQARLASLFVCLSLIIYYAFSGPVFVDTIGQLAGIHMPNGLVNVSRSIGALLALAVYSHSQVRPAQARRIYGRESSTKGQSSPRELQHRRLI